MRQLNSAALEAFDAAASGGGGWRVELNGSAAQVDDLRRLVHTNYGHFSAMQVRGGGVRGLDLHLDRIAGATRELFAATIDRDFVRACLRHAIGGREEPLSLRVNVFSRALNRERLADPARPDILVTIGPAAPAATTPLRVKSFRYARDQPRVKHVGTFPLFHYRRQAQLDGFDDALFADAHGRISEGTIWNVGFFDGEAVVWPDAPQLAGVGMQLLQAGLTAAGVPGAVRSISLDEAGAFRSAFFSNASTPVRLLASLDARTFDIDRELEQRLITAHDSNPLQFP